MHPPVSVVQFLMKNRTVSHDYLMDFMRSVSPGFSPAQTPLLLEGVKFILRNFNLTIELVRCELTGMKYYVCLSPVQREFLENHPVLSKVEEDSMFAIINACMNNDGNPIGSNDAINMIMAIEHKEYIGPDKADSILKSFVLEKILVEKPDGTYIIGPFALTSLRNYLSSHENAKSCSLCTKNVVYSKGCGSCGADMHYYCFNRAQVNENSAKCPICKK